MTKSKSYLARIGAVFAALATIAAASARKCCKNILAAMHRSREQEAARVIARYRHLSDERPSKQQKNLSKNITGITWFLPPKADIPRRRPNVRLGP
jgi:hypothetical protein